jgi:hypothetical protein
MQDMAERECTVRPQGAELSSEGQCETAAPGGSKVQARARKGSVSNG